MPGQMYQYVVELEAMHLTRVPAWFAELLNLGLTIQTCMILSYYA